MNSNTHLEYFSGNVIYGDNLSQSEIDYWFLQEENGYASLGYVDSETDYYPYHYMNSVYGWRHIPNFFPRALGIGSAFAAEFEIVASKIGTIDIIEPGKKFWRTSAFGKKLNYVMPASTGAINFPDATFDLITVFGVLHHIPNVSFVISELVRVLKPDGHLVVREPIISMGDWRKFRPGLTRNERGIPLHLMKSIITRNNCQIIVENLIGFSPMQKLLDKLRFKNYWNSKIIVKIDWLFCKVFAWNYKYHRTKLFDRFAPSTGYWVVSKSK